MNLAILNALLAVMIWGVSFVSTKAVLQEVTPNCLVFFRLFIAVIFLGIFQYWRKEKFRIERKYFLKLLLLSSIGGFIHQWIQATALQYTEATSAGWLITLSPVFTVLISFLFLKEKMKASQFIGFVISLMGVLVLTSKGHWANLTVRGSYGDLLIILSALNWAIYSILLKKLNLPYSSLTITFYLSLIGCILLCPFFLLDGLTQLKGVSLYGWFHLGFLGIFTSAIAYWLWGKSIEVLGSTKTSVFLYFEPLATVLAAILVLRETLLASTFVGGVFILCGVAIMNPQIRAVKTSSSCLKS